MEKRNVSPENRQNFQAIMQAASRVAELHAGDADLVRPGAEAHKVKVVEGGLFDPLSPGDYNPRLPSGSEEEAGKLAQVERFLSVCEDYRQSEDVARDLEIDQESGYDAVFATAGGAAQPEKDRFEADLEFYVELLRANPDLNLILTHHIGVCGGANHYTGGEMGKIREEKGEEAEINKMNEFGMKMHQAVMERVPEANVSLFLVLVDEKDEFVGLVQEK